jgi:hypothetical protein
VSAFWEILGYLIVIVIPIALQLWKSGEDMYIKKTEELRKGTTQGEPATWI